VSALAHEIDLGVRQLVLDVVNRKIKGFDTQVGQSLIDGSLERTIEGASTLTLTVHDPERALLLSGMFEYAIQVRLDRLFFRLVKIAKQGDDLALTFEDREVALLRERTLPKKASRASMTRAEFALSLVREVRTPQIPFVCPELHVRQPIMNDAQARTPAARSVTHERGIARDAELTVKGKRATQSQIRLMQRTLDVADSLDAGEKATLALVEACIVESLFANLSGGDRDSRGILQVRDSTAKGMGISNTNVAECVNAFLTRGFYHDEMGGGGAIAIAARHPEVSAGRVAQGTQGSGVPNAYDKWEAEAKKIVDAYEGGGVTSTQVVRKLPYQFRRGGTDGAPEDSWTCLQRLAEEVKWRCFMAAGACFFISETELLKARPRMILDEGSPGVTAIDFDLDTGKPVDEVSLTARARRWAAAPGAVVQLRNCGPADGRWLVASLSRSLFDAETTISLRRPAKPLAEPAPETETSTAISTSVARSIGAAGSQVDRAYRAARAIDAKRYPYVYGGGHAKAGSPSGGGYDCSGSVSAVLAAAGMGLRVGGPAMDSNRLMNWGEAGAGEFITVYARPGSTTGHAWMTFKVDGQEQHFGTGDWGKGWGGAGFNPRMHPKEGFTVRHWPGT